MQSTDFNTLLGGSLHRRVNEKLASVTGTERERCPDVLIFCVAFGLRRVRCGRPRTSTYICLCLYLKDRRLAAETELSNVRGGKKAAHSRTYPGQTDKARLPADCQEPLQGLR